MNLRAFGHLTAITAVACLAVASGCSQSSDRDASVSGTVLVAGQLASRGTVTFHPVAGGPPATGRIHSDGTYSVRTGQGDLSDADGGKLRSGDYKVTVVVFGDPVDSEIEGGPPKAGPRLSASRYASVNTTDLERTVKPGRNLFNFELESAYDESQEPAAPSEPPPPDEPQPDAAAPAAAEPADTPAAAETEVASTDTPNEEATQTNVEEQD